MHECSHETLTLLLITIAENTIAGIPNARESKLSMPQMMVVTNASMRKSCGASWLGGG